MVVYQVILLMIAPVFVLLFTYLYLFYSKLKQYPNGPKPLPFFGNTLMLVPNLNRNPSYFFKELAKNYDGLYTFWFGSKPIVFITSINLGRKAFNQIECCDRWEQSIESCLSDALFDSNSTLIIMNRNEEYKMLRRILVNGVRKFLASNNLSEITKQIVDHAIHKMVRNESGKQFEPDIYIANIFIKIISQTIFGKSLEWNDKRIEQIQKSFHLTQVNTLKCFVTEFIPALKLVFNPLKQKDIGIQTTNMFKNWFNERLAIAGQCLDDFECIADLSILMNNENSEQTDKQCDFLSNQQLFGNLNGFFFASSDTVYHTFKWMFLFMAYYPEMQQRMRSEIKENLGEQSPQIKDKNSCNFVNAFISETLRYRNVTPFGVYHSALKDTYINETRIPSGTMLVLHQDSILNDSKYWQNPGVFNPERFLDSNQKFNTTNHAAFIPFSTGKRMCIGDKFAMKILFLILTRLLQTTNGYQIILNDRENTDLEPKTFGFFTETKTYSVSLIKQ